MLALRVSTGHRASFEGKHSPPPPSPFASSWDSSIYATAPVSSWTTLHESVSVSSAGHTLLFCCPCFLVFSQPRWLYLRCLTSHHALLEAWQWLPRLMHLPFLDRSKNVHSVRPSVRHCFNFIKNHAAQVCEGQSNGFSSDFIAIEIRSPDCPDLTLIDLPGIVRTAVSGQSQGVITEVRCRRAGTVVLARGNCHDDAGLSYRCGTAMTPGCHDDARLSDKVVWV